MKIMQIMPSFAIGDAVSNDALQMDAALKEAGFETCIYADMIGKNVNKELVHFLPDMPKTCEDDVLLCHISIGSRINSDIPHMKGRKIFVYHNITPSKYFKGYNPYLEQKCRRGILEISKLKNVPDYVLAVSRYNKEHLRRLGYTCPIDVLPILLPMKDYDKSPDEKIFAQYNNDCINILFTGRIAPNKKFEDLIETFYVYNKYFNSDSKLLLVGNDAGMEQYKKELLAYTRYLGLSEQEVCFAGHVTFEELLAYYRIADVFLCMSEHEGFCVPLLEAMLFHVPVVAFDAGAVAETLGGAGILLDKKEPRFTAAILDVLCQHSILKDEIISEQDKRLCDFDEKLCTEMFIKYINDFLSSDYKENKSSRRWRYSDV